MKITLSFSKLSAKVSILACCLTLISFSGYSQLSGDYTVDPAGVGTRNFISFQSAIDSLHAVGVDGPVFMNVADGTYEEQVQINQITGTSAVNRVTFQSQSLDSTKVTLKFESSTSTNYWTLRLNVANYVTIRKMRLQGDGSYVGRVININGSAHDIIIENCQFKSNTTSTQYSELIWSGNDETDNITIRNNFFLFGSRGIDMEGIGSSQLGTRLEVYNNSFLNQKYTAILIDVYDAPKIHNNTINMINGTGISVEFCFNSTEVRNNTILMDKGVGIHSNRSKGNAIFKGLIANNFIRVKGNTTHGIRLFISEYFNIYHNSVLITDPSTSVNVNCFFLDDYGPTGYSSNIELKNNIFANIGGGTAVNIESNWAITASDHNVFYAAGDVLAVWTGDHPDLQSHQAANSGKDINSLSLDPRFLSIDDLHVDNYWLDGAGDASLGITTDIDGDIRMSPPDIGADEFTPSQFPLAAGTYTIGGTMPSYDKVKDAFDDLQLLGILGPVTLEIRNGLYEEYIGEVTSIQGASAANSIIFRSESGNPEDVVIRYSTDLSDRNIFELDGVDHITFKDITVSALGTGYGRTFNLLGDCENIRFENNVLSSNNSVDAVVSLNEGVKDDIVIKDNLFSKGSRGIYFYGSDISYSRNTVIESNTITGARYEGMDLRYHSSPIIRGNIISSSDFGGFTGIKLTSCDLDLVVNANSITVESGNSGIHMDNCNAVLPSIGLIANNMIQVGGSDNAYGIWINDCNRQNIYYNSLHITGTNSASGRGIFIENNNEYVEIKSNINANSGGGYALWVNDGSDVSSSDNNGFYTSGVNLASWGGSDYTTLAALRTESNMDANSLVAEPLFYSDIDLHTMQELFHEAATPLTMVIDDIDGNLRDPSTPDMGAMEFTCIEPDFNVYISPVCLGDTTMIIDSTEYIAPGSSRDWDLEGNDYAPEVSTEHQYDTILWVFDNPGENTINYIVKQIAGCNDFVALTAEVIPEPVLQIETKGAYCDSTDGWAEVTVTNIEGPFQYAWSNGSTENRAEDLALGEEISVAVRDEAAGCTARADTVIGEAIELNISLLSPSTCGDNDGSAIVSATGGFAPYEFVWSNGYTTAQNDSLTPGPHYVNVIDNKGCYATGFINVESDGGPQITLLESVNNDCYGETSGSLDISISNGVAPYDILWSNGETSEDIDELAAGIYNVVVTDAENCLGAGSFQVGQQSQISISTIISPATCEGSDGSAVALVSGGTRPYVYQWSTGGHFEIEEGFAAGVYSLTVLDGKGCEMVEPVIVSNVNAPVVSIDEVNGIGCTVIDNGSITASASPSNPFYTYSWSSGQSTPTINNLTAGTYIVTVTDEEGCSGVNQAVIEQEPPDVPPICIVSVDTTSGKNILIWVKENTEDLSHYNIYRESSVKGKYLLVDTVNINSESSYIDEVADPSIRSWRYKLSAVDVCGYESELSPHHKTMHLTMNLGLDGNVNLIWDHYEGFPVQTYKVWRYDAGSNWLNITNMPSNLTSYTDISPPNEDLTYYIEVLHPGGCEASEKKPAKLNSTRSNRRSSKKSGTKPGGIGDILNISEFRIYPNPGDGVYKLELELPGLEEAGIKVYDVTGKILYVSEYSDIQSRLETEIDLSDYSNGFYQVQIVAGNALLHRILIKE